MQVIVIASWIKGKYVLMCGVSCDGTMSSVAFRNCTLGFTIPLTAKAIASATAGNVSRASRMLLAIHE